MEKLIQQSKKNRETWSGSNLKKTSLQSNMTRRDMDDLNSKRESPEETATYSTWFIAGHNVRI